MLTPISDPSTIKDLRPNHALEFGVQRFKNSMRYHGSHILNLKRPNRTGEFSRPYAKGDPPHLIDWKVFARSDTLLIREQRDEASATIRIVIDCTDTMSWPDAKTRADLPSAVPTKLELAIRIALNLAYIHIHIGDLVKIHIDTGQTDGPSHIIWVPTATAALSTFEVLLAKNFTREALLIEAQESLSLRPEADICYWLSDALGPQNSHLAQDAARAFKFIHVLTSLEVQSDWMDSEFCYFDHVQDDKEFLGTALKHLGSYQHQINRWQEGMRKTLHSGGYGYQVATERTLIRAFHDELPEL